MNSSTVRAYLRVFGLGRAFVSLTFLNACFSSKDVFGDLDSKTTAAAGAIDFNGCIEGYGLDTGRIRVDFEFPSSAQQMRVLRNGSVVYATSDSTENHFIDFGLNEGQSYRYTCEALIDDKSHLGKRSLTVSTQNSNPPSFAGIQSVSMIANNRVRVSWLAAAGVAVDQYVIYGNAGTSVDFGLEPIKTVSPSQYNYNDLVDLVGDQLDYVFAVRACSIGDICDTNTASRSLAALPDRGAPRTPGATQALIDNGQVIVIAPWLAQYGAVASRRVYGRVLGSGAAFALIQEFPVSTPSEVPSSLTLVPSVPFSQNTSYEFYVQDEDPSGGLSSTTNVRVSINMGDTQKPIFAGIVATANGANSETQVQVSFNSIASQDPNPSLASDPNGAYEYVFYTRVLAPTSSLSACTGGVLHSALETRGYNTGVLVQHTLSGLLARTRYSVCIKARDKGGNVSDTFTHQIHTTRDLTPPQFGGSATSVFDNSSGEVAVTWNASPSADLSHYRLKVFRGSPASPTNLTTLSSRTVATSGTGTSFGSDEFAFVDNELIYVLVDACDNALDAGFNTQNNCTTLPLTQARIVPIPDISPPPGFAGITGATDVVATEGSVTVAWAAPADWSQYRGFKVYRIGEGGALSLLRDCACTAFSCPEEPTSCVVTGLSASRTYNFHVRAYDAAFNETVLSTTTSRATLKTQDLTPPVFSSSLAIAGSSPPVLTWHAGTDNQYEGAVTYQIYRKAGTSAADGFASYPPTVGGSVSTVYNGALLTRSDSSLIQAGPYYFYVACARDAAGNASCDENNIPVVRFADLTPPVFTTAPRIFAAGTSTAKGKKDSSWDLDWDASDNLVNYDQLSVSVFQATSLTDSQVQATEDDQIIFGPATGSPPKLEDLSGPASTTGWISYLVKIEDPDGNFVTETISTAFDSRITLTSVSPNTGITSGGTLLVIEGEGFSPQSVVKIGNDDCLNLRFVTYRALTCETPAGTGAKSVRVLNGSSQSTALNFTYGAGNICDRSGDWGSTYAAGAGTALDPYILCSPGHIASMRATPSGHFALGRNIDMSAVTLAPTAASLNGSFDGRNLALLDLMLAPTTDYVQAFFGAAPDFRNLIVTNGRATALHQHSAILIARPWPGHIANIRMYGGELIVSADRVGAVTGYSQGSGSVSDIYTSVKLTITGGNGVGCVSGFTEGTFDNVHSECELDIRGGAFIGGVVGKVFGGGASLSNSQFSGKITISSNAVNVGGVAGTVQISTSNLSATDFLITSASQYSPSFIGGIFGSYDGGTFTGVGLYSDGVIDTPGATLVGGIAGGAPHSGSVTFRRVASNVNITASTGLAGITYGQWTTGVTVYDSYVTGTLKSTRSTAKAPGMCGAVCDSTNGALNAYNSYVSVQLVSSAITRYNVYGQSGEPVGGTDTNFFEKDATYNTGITGTVSNFTEQTRANLRTSSTFTAKGWDFVGESVNGTNNYWNIVPGVNDGRPCLVGVTPGCTP